MREQALARLDRARTEAVVAVAAGLLAGLGSTVLAVTDLGAPRCADAPNGCQARTAQLGP